MPNLDLQTSTVSKYSSLTYSFPPWTIFYISILCLLSFPEEFEFSEEHWNHFPFLPFKLNSSCVKVTIHHISHPTYKSILKIKCYKEVYCRKLTLKDVILGPCNALWLFVCCLCFKITTVFSQRREPMFLLTLP